MFMAMSLFEQLLLYIRPKVRFNSTDRHIKILDHIENGRAVRLLLYDDIRESGMYLDGYGDIDPLFHYMKTLKIMWEHYPDLNSMLLIGGGGFVLPKIFLKERPLGSVNVVELDPGYVELARQYFYLDTNDKRLTINITDGYRYLDEHAGKDKYDLVVYDAYTGDNAASTILSEHALKNVYSLLKPNGIYALNMINESTDVYSMLTRITEATLKTIFRHTRIVPCKGGGNCILMASDRKI